MRSAATGMWPKESSGESVASVEKRALGGSRAGLSVLVHPESRNHLLSVLALIQKGESLGRFVYLLRRR